MHGILLDVNGKEWFHSHKEQSANLFRLRISSVSVGTAVYKVYFLNLIVSCQIQSISIAHKFTLYFNCKFIYLKKEQAESGGLSNAFKVFNDMLWVMGL